MQDQGKPRRTQLGATAPRVLSGGSTPGSMVLELEVILVQAGEQSEYTLRRKYRDLVSLEVKLLRAGCLPAPILHTAARVTAAETRRSSADAFLQTVLRGGTVESLPKVAAAECRIGWLALPC